jgi:tRNA (guanine10-N2)-dimethyltransferase
VSDRLFFVVSGEHPSLPHAEIRAILESSRIGYREVAAASKLLRLRADSSALDAVAKRSMMYEHCGVEIATAKPDGGQLARILDRTDLAAHFSNGRRFAVRSLRVKGAFKRLARDGLERDIGKTILERNRRARVDLTRPDVTFLCIVYKKGLLFGRVTHSRTPGVIASRRPRKRPVFHPSTMPPKLARCLVNLSRPTEKATVLDPFCGVGGILLEGAVAGCRAVGGDADLRMIKGAKMNLRYFGVEPSGLVIHDATRLPFRSVESIVTDPPYGREASTRGRELRDLLREFLPEASRVLPRGGFLCICSPSHLRLRRIAEKQGFKITESHLVYVHRSLTRRVLVLRKS